MTWPCKQKKKESSTSWSSKSTKTHVFTRVSMFSTIHEALYPLIIWHSNEKWPWPWQTNHLKLVIVHGKVHHLTEGNPGKNSNKKLRTSVHHWPFWSPGSHPFPSTRSPQSPNQVLSRTTRRHRAIALRFGQTSGLSNRYSFPIQNQANINRTYQKHHQQQQQQQQQQHKYVAYMILYVYIYTVRVDKSKQWGSWVFKPVFWQPLTIVLVA